MKNIYLFFAILCISCAPDHASNTDFEGSDLPSSAKGQQRTGIDVQQLNLTILLDLSDRIDPKTSPDKPEHYQKDISLINYFSDYFVKEMKRKGAYKSKDKFKVIFSPKPEEPNINIAAEKLNIDLSKMDVKQKKDVYDNLYKVVNDNITQIYETTLKEGKWPGSDIWRFFKNDVKDYAVERDPNYRNILVVLTDGYIYHDDSKDQRDHRYAYLLPSMFQEYKLRNNANWDKIIDKYDVGLITTRNDLDNLEVLILEITPSALYKNDEDIIKKLLHKWLNEMNVKRAAIFNSDLPEYTKKRIDDFLN